MTQDPKVAGGELTTAGGGAEEVALEDKPLRTTRTLGNVAHTTTAMMEV